MTNPDLMEELATPLVEQIRDLAAGTPALGDTLPISARMIGLLCFTLVETCKERRHIPKKRLHAFEERALRLREEGDQVSIRYEAVMNAETPLYLPPPNVRHFPTPIIYEERRTELAKNFVELEEELRALSRKRRGRPAGPSNFGAIDYEIIVEALLAALKSKAPEEWSSIDGAFTDAVTAAIDTAVAAAIADRRYPSRGGLDAPPAKAHKQRIKRRIPFLLEAIRRRVETDQ